MKKLTTNLVSNFDENLAIVLDYAKKNKISKILIFTKDGQAAIRAKSKISGDDISVIAVSFPANEPIYKKNDDGEVIEFTPETSTFEVREKLASYNIELILSSLPFEDIIVPGSRINTNNIIEKSLNLFDNGISLCVQSVLMTTDAGYTYPGERVISMIANSAIDISASNSKFIFHPKKGVRINNIICKKE